MPALSAFRKLVTNSQSRSRRRTKSYSVPAAEVLEFRTLLTNAAPDIIDLSGASGEVSGTAIDDGSGGSLSIEIKSANGSEEISIIEGEEFTVDITHFIPANTSEMVAITITETNFDEDGELEELSTTKNILASGMVIEPIDIDWISAYDAMVFGVVQTDNLPNAVMPELMYRAVGETDWIFGSSIDESGNFALDVTEADGETDFEFAVLQTDGAVTVEGGIKTLYDLSPGENGEGDGDGNADGNGDQGGSGNNNQGDDDDDDDDDNGLWGW